MDKMSWHWQGLHCSWAFRVRGNPTKRLVREPISQLLQTPQFRHRGSGGPRVGSISLLEGIPVSLDSIEGLLRHFRPDVPSHLYLRRFLYRLGFLGYSVGPQESETKNYSLEKFDEVLQARVLLASLRITIARVSALTSRSLISEVLSYMSQKPGTERETATPVEKDARTMILIHARK